MQNLTTVSTSTLPSITPDLLLLVSGGCHKKHCGGGCRGPITQQTIVNLPPAPQILPQATPTPPDPTAQAMPQPMPQFSGGGDIVKTNVSINGQPVSA
jgi:hypothetical protein